MMKYNHGGGRVFPVNTQDMREAIAPGVYHIVKPDDGPMHLKRSNDFSVGKIYGSLPSGRVMETFLERRKQGRNTGVLLVGDKGGGKTLLAKVIANEIIGMGGICVMVNEVVIGQEFNDLIGNIQQPCMVLFDEFEKVYNERPHQSAMLSFFDGTGSGGKLLVMTVNDEFSLVNEYISRPGRLYYRFDYMGVAPDVAKDYCNDNLTDTSKVGAVLAVFNLIEPQSFDTLSAIVEECNRFDVSPEDAVVGLNLGVRHAYGYHRVISLEIDGELIANPHKVVGGKLHINNENYWGVSVGEGDDEYLESENCTLTHLPNDILEIHGIDDTGRTVTIMARREASRRNIYRAL